MDFVVGVDGNISIMLPKTDISFMIDASKNEVASHVIEIGVDSNLTHGVVIGMTTAYSNTSDDDTTANALNSIHGYTIPALDSTVHKSLFPVNHWGYSVDDGTYYNRMPAANEGVMGEILIENPSAINFRRVFIGAKANISQPLDYYYTTINFTAVTNFAAKTIDDIIYMQEMTPDVVESMETNRQYRLRDSRDKKDYWIAKFDDGNVWMTQNLDLDLSPSLILTDEDSDLVDRTWAAKNAKRVIDYNKTESYRMITGSLQYGHARVDINGTYRYALTRGEDMYGSSINECLMKYEDNPKFCNHFKNGQNYTWLEAVAANNIDDVVEEDHGMISVNESICPKGWRLPTSFYDGSTWTSDLPKTTSTQIREYDDKGILQVSGTLSANLNREPFFFLPDMSYWTSTITDASSYSNEYARILDGRLGSGAQEITYAVKVRCKARPSNTFSLEFDLNGGTGTTPNSIEADSWTSSYTFNLAEIPSGSIPIKEGYTIIGWATSPDALYPEVISSGMDNNNNIIYGQNGQRVTSKYTTANANTRLYAVWEQSVDLKFNANGGRFTGNLYAGENEEAIKISYSTPISGVTESAKVTYSSNDCNGNSKNSIDDTRTYCSSNSNRNSYSFGSEYDYVDVTVYYAISGDSTLCIYDDTNNGNYNYSYCNQSLSGNLADGAYFDASNHYLYSRHYIIKNPSNTFSYGWRGGTNTDGRTQWYGFWIEAKAIKTDTNVQYLRSERRAVSTPTREGYRFVGWSTNPDATFVNWEYNSNLRYAQSMQLYAVWVACPTVTVAFNTESSHVQIETSTILWNTAQTITIQKNGNSQWYYYDTNTNSNVVLATITASSDRFYTVASSVSTQTLSTSLARDLNEGDTYTVTFIYNEEPVEDMHQLTRESCSAAPLHTTQQMNDARDNKKYWVTKMADGNCWMTQNLDLFISTGGTTLTSETSTVTGSQTVYAASSWSTSSSSNSYFDGGDYYYANGLTPTATSDLASDSELWHYHQGSYYNKKLSKMVCPAGWQLGDYRRLYNAYGVNQINAMVYSTVGNTPLQAPFYQIIDYSTPSSNKPSETNNQLYTLYWSTSYFARDLVLTYTPPNYSENYNTPLVLYSPSADTTNLTMITNTDRYYRYSENPIYRTAGFVRCMR